MKKQSFTLPEFAFLDGNSHDGDTLDGRTILQHIRSYTVLEVFAIDDFKRLHLDCQTFEFDYTNHFGITERHVFGVHFTLADPDDMPEIFEKSRVWYCDYLKWEDENIIDDEDEKHKSLHN